MSGEAAILSNRLKVKSEIVSILRRKGRSGGSREINFWPYPPRRARPSAWDRAAQYRGLTCLGLRSEPATRLTSLLGGGARSAGFFLAMRSIQFSGPPPIAALIAVAERSSCARTPDEKATV